MARGVALLAAAVVVVALVGTGAFLVARPPTLVASAVDRDVTIECAASSGADEAACLAWGDRILAEGAPTTTFEAEDLVRLRLDRSLLGLGVSCRAEWFLSRYPGDVAWAEELDCPS